MNFDQGRYWVKRGKHFIEEFARHDEATKKAFKDQEDSFRRILSNYNLSDVKSILEIGCGFGRMTAILMPFLSNREKYLCLDISKAQIDAARDFLKSQGFELPEFRIADFRREKFGEIFDLVIATEVLKNFTPKEIRFILSKAQRLSNKLFIHIDPFLERYENVFRRMYRYIRRILKGKPFRWDWYHDYPKLYNHSLVKKFSIYPILNGRQHVFIVERK